MEWKVISQRNWLKGLQATFARFSQPQGIITRLSNLLYDFRGGLRTSDGSFIFSQLAGANNVEGPINEVTLYSPSGQDPYYVGLLKSQAAQIPVPSINAPTFSQVGGTISTAARVSGVTTITFAAAHHLVPNSNPSGQLIQSGVSTSAFNVTVPFSTITITGADTYTYPDAGINTSGTGGSMTTGLATGIAAGDTYDYVVTASDGQGGETPASGVASGNSGSPNNAITISWTAVPNAVGYNVYGRNGAPLLELNTPGNTVATLISGTSFVDLGGAPFTPFPPGTNTTQTLAAYKMTAPTFGAPQLLGTFPSYFAPPLGGIPGATSPSTASPGGGATPQGGIVGATSPLPQIIQFANKLIFALGNGFAPQEYLDPNSGGTGAIIPVGNNYAGQYTDWQASVTFLQGDIIHDSVSGGLFKAQQGGQTAATRPSFVDTLNAQTPEVSPGTIVWVCIATSATGTPLRGAACAIVYAGSLWLANTYPTTTTDFLDGPCCIKMSDVNNPESWNPSNVAFLSKDDGDQITSLNTFTIAESGIAPTGSLVVFKNFSTFQITGVFGATDLTIIQAQTDMGNIAGRSSQFIPGFGIARLTHLGFAYFNGVNDKLISEEIRPYLFGGQADIATIDWNFAYLSKGAQAANPPMYVCACPIIEPVLQGVTITGPGGTFSLFVRVEKLVNGDPVSISPEVQVSYSTTAQFTVTTPAAATGVTYRVFAGYLAGGENLYTDGASFNVSTITLGSMTPGFLALGNGGLTRIFAYDLVQKQWAIIDIPFPISTLKQVRSPGTIPITVAGGASDAALRRLFAGDEEWDNGDPVTWMMGSAELFQQGGSAKIFFRRLVLRGFGNIGGKVNVGINLQGATGIPVAFKVRTLAGGQWEVRVDIMKDAANANATLSGSGPAQITMDSMDWYVKPKPAGIPTSIQQP